MTIMLACSKKTDWRRYVVIVSMPVAGRHEDAVPEACIAVKHRAENFSGYTVHQ
ncbi:hypothetical protein [Pantoea agglomerans]